jgi:hypothetical protein
MSNGTYYCDRDEFDEDDYELIERDFTWAGHLFNYTQFASAVFHAAAHLTEEIGRDLAGVHNKAIEAIRFRRTAGKEIETILKGS